MDSDMSRFVAPFARRLAHENGIATLANMIIVGKMMKECDFLPYKGIEHAVRTIVSAKHADLFDLNMKAIEIGHRYE